MPGDCLPEDLQVLWKEMSMSPLTFSPPQLRAELEKLNEGKRRKSIVFLAAMGTLIVSFASFFFLFPNTLARTGSVLSVFGLVYWLVQTRMSRARPISEMGDSNCIQFYRAELERRRDLSRGFPLWSRILLAMPPWIVFNLGFAQLYPNLAPIMWFDCGTIVAVIAFIVPMGLRQARMYQRRIDLLDASQSRS